MTYNEILDRDVPIIRSHSQAWARQGICAPIEIYYKHEAIAGQSIACNHDMTLDGWKPTGITIPCNVPYEAYWRYLYQRMGNVPIFAEKS